MMSETASTAGMDAWARLLRAGQGALRDVEGDLKSAGFPPLVWYDILLELERAPNGRLRHRDIRREMLLERYSVTRIVERLEREGLVESEPCPDDARGAVVHITAAGRGMRKRMWTVYEAAVQKRFASHYSDRELKSLSHLLAKSNSL